MFDASLNAALKKSDFQKTCTGKIVRLVFHFEITGQLADNLKETVAYGYPNEFWIISERQGAQIN